MTISAVWTDDNCASLWAVADTRLTSVQSGPNVRLSDNASKLLSIPYACRAISSEPGFELKPFFWGSFGFAFAGNSSAALLTATTATTLLAMLMAPQAQLPPKLCDIVATVTKIAEHFCRSSLAAHNGNAAGSFEAIVFGHCPWSKLGEVYHLRPSLVASNFIMEFESVNIKADSKYFAIGSGSTLLAEELTKLTEYRADRLPLRALQNIINVNNLSVGGYMSLGISQPFEFKPYWIPEPIDSQNSKAWRSYNGIDIDVIGKVGACMIGGQGMRTGL
jgi:hypothetical protein